MCSEIRYCYGIVHFELFSHLFIYLFKINSFTYSQLVLLDVAQLTNNVELYFFIT